MPVDLETLLTPISEDAPCGPDLSYDLERHDLARVFESDVSIDINGPEEGKPARKIDWPSIIDRILSQSTKTKDIWLAVHLCRAGAAARRLDVVADGAELLCGLFDRYWESVHPQLIEVQLTGRQMTCDVLGKRAFLGPLGGVPIFDHQRLGTFRALDLHRFGTNGETEPDIGAFREALSEAGDSALVPAKENLKRIDTALHRAEALFAEKGDGKILLDFGPLYEFLSAAEAGIAVFLASPAGEPGEAAPNAAAAGETTVAAPGALRGAVQSREDVVRALDAVMDYYRKREPSSPVLPLLERAKTWVPMSFLDVLTDIAPETMADAMRVLAKRTDVKP